MYVCVRGGPNQPLHRDPQWSIVLFMYIYSYITKLPLRVIQSQHDSQTCSVSVLPSVQLYLKQRFGEWIMSPSSGKNLLSLAQSQSPDTSKSESELLYDWRFTADQFVLATNSLRLTTTNFIFQLNTCGCRLYVTSSLMR
jgi:hypothetical protein